MMRILEPDGMNRQRMRWRSHTRHGFTLMEMLISIGLMTLLMAALYSAMTIYVNLQTDSHDEIERVQISRTLLRQISRDIQSVVFEEQDTTGDSAESSGDDTTASDSETTEITVDPESAMTQYTNGLVGTESDLTLFVNRPDRNLDYVSAQELASFSERSSDMMMIRYFVAESGAGGIASEIAQREGMGGQSGSVGLIRMTGDLYGLSMAIMEGEEQSQISATTIQAPEVTRIRFQYFDGAAWVTEWNSNDLNMMPLAVEVILTLQTADPLDPTAPSRDKDPTRLGETSHRMVVSLPVAKPFVPQDSL